MSSSILMMTSKLDDRKISGVWNLL